MPGKRKVAYTKRSVFYPCGACRQNCSTDVIQCDSCSSWYHYSCEDLTNQDIAGYSGSMDFQCFQCLRDEIGPVYSFFSTLFRLNLAANYGLQSLTAIAKREAVVMQGNTLPIPNRVNPTSYNIDYVSSLLLQQYNITGSGTPVSVTANGNCLFNSLSVSLYGTEHYATELRVRTCIQLCLNSNLYVYRPCTSDILSVSPTYQEACLHSAHNYEYASAWTIMAASDVLCMNINCVYPPCNGSSDFVYDTLNRCFSPSNVWPTGTLTIMWTSMTLFNGGIWTPNHFVPLLGSNPSHSSPVPSQDRNITPPSPRQSPIRSPIRSPTANSSVYSSPVQSPVANSYADSSPLHPPVANSYVDSSPLHPPVANSIVYSSPLQSPVANSSVDSSPLHPPVTNSSVYSSPVQTPIPVEPMSDESCNDTTDNNIQECTQGKIIFSGKWLTSEQLYYEINTSNDIFSNVPTGPKNNKIFVVDNSSNSMKQGNQQRSNFFDDCGVWASGQAQSAKTTHILSQNLKQVTKKGENYCVRVKRNGVYSWVSLEPQPVEEDVVILHRYYATLKCDNSYKKRVSWFTSTVNTDIGKKAVYEYLGTFPTQNQHFFRTNPETIDKMRAKVGKDRPQAVYADQLHNNISINQPRDTKQVRNLNHRETKKLKVASHQHNVADDILQVIDMVDTHEFVQEIVHTKQRVPSIICYTTQQLQDMKHFITTKSGKLGIDRTFNLGQFYVTTIVFKNHRLIRKETKDNPIFLGPLFLHQQADYNTYRAFFNKLSSELQADFDLEIRIPEIMELGTDDEKALTKALEHSFPNSTRYLCTKHLKDNLKHYMTNRATIPIKERETITQLIFDTNGLCNANDTFTFEQISSEITSSTNNTQFIDYFNNFFKNRVNNYVRLPNVNAKQSGLWTNNNAESINHILKINTNWKPQSLTALIEKLFSVVKLQYLDARRALYGAGNFCLSAQYSLYAVQEAVWRQKTKEQKDNAFEKFLKDSKRKKCSDRIQSADGKFSTWNKARTIKTKPGQRKRTVNERTKAKR